MLIFLSAFVVCICVIEAQVPVQTWPGSTTVTPASVQSDFGDNLSGLHYVSNTEMWAVQNKPSKVYKLTLNGGVWEKVTDDSWSSGKTISKSL